MDSITQNSKNTKRYLPHDVKTSVYVSMMWKKLYKKFFYIYFKILDFILVFYFFR